MSLINRMLRDLSARKPSGDVMSGIQLPVAPARPRSSAPGRLGLLAVLVVAFTAGLWWMFAPRPAPTPQPRTASAGATVAASVPAPAPVAPVPPAEPAPATPAATAAPPAEPHPGAQLKLDTKLEEPVPATPVRKASRPKSVAKPAPAGEKPAAAAAPAPVAESAQVASAPAPAAEPATVITPAAPVATAPDDSARKALAYAHLREGRPADALAVLERDVPSAERDPEYQALLASAYQRLGRHEQAARAYENLVRVEPQRAAWWVGYGLARDALGDASTALAAYERARALGGLDPRVLEHINARTAALQPAG